MTAAGDARSIRDLFSTARPIDRPIEKVIDYAAVDDAQLASEIGEYEVTENLNAAFQKFLDVYGQGVRTGEAPEVGVWVSGFYGSGKSSFTKYLGFALDGARTVHGRPFVELLAERIDDTRTRADLLTLANREPTAVVMLDLGSEQLAGATQASVTNVLWWKALRWAGYSARDNKVAQLEFDLERRGKLEAFERLYRERNGSDWRADHNIPTTAISRAARLLPDVLPGEYLSPDDFLRMRLEPIENVTQRAADIIDLVRRKSGHRNVLFVIDEVGQYVAPRGELILNLDGLARSLKEQGQGRVWIVATGQQTLAETEAAAAFNARELFKLKDRFPVSIDLQAQDIREITWRRLLKKSSGGEAHLRRLYGANHSRLASFTRLEASQLYRGEPSEAEFMRLYPFLPQHFEILFALIRTLARSTGGIGLRSAIRVVQDVLVDAGHALPVGEQPLASLQVGALARVDQFYDMLRSDVARVLPHVAAGIDQVARIFPGDQTVLRVAKAVGALQVIEGFPRTADNVAALLYPALGAEQQIAAVQKALQALVDDRECGVVNDPQAGGYQFLSGGTRVLRDERDQHVPSSAEVSRCRSEALLRVLDPLPSALIEETRRVKGGVYYETTRVSDQAEELNFQLQPCSGGDWDERRADLLARSRTREMAGRIVWLFREPEGLEETLVEQARSRWLGDTHPEPHSDLEIGKFVRGEQERMARLSDGAATLLRRALMEGTFICDGRATPAATRGDTPVAAANAELKDAGARLYPRLRLAAVRTSTDLAARFLEVERLDRITTEQDPLGLVTRAGGTARVNTDAEVLAEALREFERAFEESGQAPVRGAVLLDRFERPPWGWNKDVTRYVIAALLAAGQVEVRNAGETFKTPGPRAAALFKSTPTFRNAGIARRDSRVSLETLQRAADRLRDLFADNTVFPTEQGIADAVRRHVPGLREDLKALPERLRLLELPGEDSARDALDRCAALVQGDGGGAADLLGAADGALTEEIQWARRTDRALNEGAEDDVRQAQGNLMAVRRLERLFGLPNDHDEIDRAATTIEDVLQSMDFGERRPEMRTSTAALLGALGRWYDEACLSYLEACAAALGRLEALNDWSYLPTDEQHAFASRLMPTSPPDRTNDIAADILSLLGRQQQIEATLARVSREVEQRTTAIVDAGRTAVDEQMERPVERLRLEQLGVPARITSDEELSAWLEAVRQRVRRYLREGIAVEIGEAEAVPA